MTAWIVVGSVLLFLLLVLVLLFTVRFYITLDMDHTMSLTVRCLLWTYKVLPKKKKDYNIRRYTLKKIRKREKKAAKKAARAASKRQKRSKEKVWERNLMHFLTPEEQRAYKRAKKATRPALSDLVPLIRRVLKLFASRFFGKVHIKVARLNVRVGSSDAMKAAVLYGVVNQSVQYLVEGLNQFTHVDGLDKAEINIAPDFLSDKIEYDFNLTVRLSLGHLVAALLKAGWKLFFGYLDIKPDAEEAEKTVARMELKAKERRKELQVDALKQAGIDPARLDSADKKALKAADKKALKASDTRRLPAADAPPSLPEPQG